MRWPFQRRTEDSWTASTVIRGGKPVGLTLRFSQALSLKDTFPFLVRVKIALSSHQRDLRSLEDRLEGSLERCNAIMVATIVQAGEREWLCYSTDGQKAAQTLAWELEEFSPTLEVVTDPEWTQYFAFQPESSPQRAELISPNTALPAAQKFKHV